MPAAQQKISTRTLIFVLASVSIFSVMLWPYMTRLPVMDEGILIYEGLRVAHGELPYRDFFDFIWPGTFYWIAGLIKFAGVSLFVIRATVLASLAICLGITTLIGRKFLPIRWLGIITGLLWIFNFPRGFQIEHHLLSITAGLAAVWFLGRWLENAYRQNTMEPNRNLILSGLCCGLSILFLQSIGGFLSLSLILFLSLFLKKQFSRLNVKVIALFVGTLSILPASLLLFFWQAGALPNFIDATITWLHRGGYLQTTDTWYYREGFFKLLTAEPYLKLVYFLQGMLPILGLIWPLDLLIRNSNHPGGYTLAKWRILLLWLAGIGLFLSGFSNPNSVTIAYHGMLLYLLAVISLFNVFRRHPKTEVCLLSGLAVLILWSVTQQVNKSWQMLKSERLISFGTVEYLLYPPEGFDKTAISFYRGLTYWLHEHAPPGKSLFIYNLQPELYLLADRQNPTRYQYLLGLYNTPAQIEETARALLQKRPRYILYNHLDSFLFKQDYRFSKLRQANYRMEPIEAVLAKRYRLFSKFSQDFWLYELQEH